MRLTQLSCHSQLSWHSVACICRIQQERVPSRQFFNAGHQRHQAIGGRTDGDVTFPNLSKAIFIFNKYVINERTHSSYSTGSNLGRWAVEGAPSTVTTIQYKTIPLRCDEINGAIIDCDSDYMIHGCHWTANCGSRCYW